MNAAKQLDVSKHAVSKLVKGHPVTVLVPVDYQDIARQTGCRSGRLLKQTLSREWGLLNPDPPVADFVCYRPPYVEDDVVLIRASDSTVLATVSGLRIEHPHGVPCWQVRLRPTYQLELGKSSTETHAMGG